MCAEGEKAGRVLLLQEARALEDQLPAAEGGLLRACRRLHFWSLLLTFAHCCSLLPTVAYLCSHFLLTFDYTLLTFGARQENGGAGLSPELEAQRSGNERRPGIKLQP